MCAVTFLIGKLLEGHQEVDIGRGENRVGSYENTSIEHLFHNVF